MSTIYIVLPIPPGLLAINRKHEPQTRTRKNKTKYTAIGTADAFKAAYAEAVVHVRQAKVTAKWTTRETGVLVDIFAAWPEHKGDIDAPIKACLDALQAGGIVTDDRQCNYVTASRAWGAHTGRIMITVRDWGDADVPHTEETTQEALALSGDTQAPSLVSHVLEEMAKAVRELRATDRGPRDTPANRKLIATATKAHALDATLWSSAIRRQLANVRPDRSKWTYLSLSTICRPANMARLLDAPDPGVASPRGRAEPGPRPTSTRVVDLRALRNEENR